MNSDLVLTFKLVLLFAKLLNLISTILVVLIAKFIECTRKNTSGKYLNTGCDLLVADFHYVRIDLKEILTKHSMQVG